MKENSPRDLKRYLIQSSPFAVTLTIGVAVVVISVSMTVVLGSFFIPPEKMLKSLSLAVLIPALIAPPIVWTLLILLRQLSVAENHQRKLVLELTRTIAEVKTLRGLLPICAGCKNFRDDAGYWHEVEAFLSEHTEAEFSHSFCPDCMRTLYPEYAEEIFAKHPELDK